MAPLIGITTSPRMLPMGDRTVPAHTSLSTYSRIVIAAGATPVLLVPTDATAIDGLLDRLDGVVLSGGGDVDPAHYGGAANPAVYGVEAARDTFEIALARRLRARRMPTLCVCRGIQVMNVALGGSLIEHIPDEPGDHLDHWVADPGRRPHTVAITPGTATAKALGTEEVAVNSIHHQAVRRVADGLVVTGIAPDGIVEALEPADDWSMWAVQWHPEALGADDIPSLGLFAALVDASR